MYGFIYAIIKAKSEKNEVEIEDKFCGEYTELGGYVAEKVRL